MGKSEEKSRRGVLAILVALGIGLVRFGEDILTNKHVMSALGRSGNEIKEKLNGSENDSTIPENDENISGISVNNTESGPLFPLWNVDTEVTLESSEYLYWEFDFEEASTIDKNPHMDYDILIREGAAINFYILQQEEFEAFEQNHRFRPHTGSETGVSIQTEGFVQLDSHKYYAVVENKSNSIQTQETKVSVEISFTDV